MASGIGKKQPAPMMHSRIIVILAKQLSSIIVSL
jgi:hypothetical protein